MRNLFLLAGEPAVGKSSWIKENNLEMYTLSSDNIRLLIETPRINTNGEYYISQKNDKRVWQLLFEILEEKMKRGETVFIDATHSRARLINQYRKLAKKYRYRVTVINFHGRKTLEQVLQDNSIRGYKAVPEKVIKNVYERLETMEFPGWVKVIKPEEFSTEIKYDWNEFDYIVVIGDIHGNYYTLLKLVNEVGNYVDRKVAYVFVGDYFDRGKFNADVFFYLNEFKENNFTILLTGNHEFKWLPRYEEFINGEFIGRKPPKITLETYQQFKDNGITVKDVKEFYNKLGQLVYVNFGIRDYVITHGGIPTRPHLFMPTEDFIFGVGNYEDSEVVDNTFSTSYPDGSIISIHGHRNIFNVPIHNTEWTYNINGTAEIEGGELRAVVINKNGDIKEVSMKGLNPTMKPRIRKENKGFTEGSVLKLAEEHKFIKVKDQGNNIYSINFSNKAFRQRKWDELTVKARGLFVALDNEGNEFVIARSYNKFFNLNEREETKLSNLTPAEFPATVYYKENGFLGLLSVDPRNGGWFVSTKGSMYGDYVEMFKEIIVPKLTKELKDYILENNVTFVFEVIHKNDPHIVDYYGKNDLFLLDVIKNRIDKEDKLDYNELCEVADKFGLQPKQLYKVINDYAELMDFVDHENSYMLMTNKCYEGTVIEFSDGFKVKIKTNWYKFWKQWRGRKFHVAKIKGDKGKINQFKEGLHLGEDFIVLDYMLKCDCDLVNTDIITIRKKLLEEVK